MRKNPVLENEMKRYTRNMKCAWIILGVNLVLALFALIAQMGLSGRENYMTILQYRFPIQCYVLMGKQRILVYRQIQCGGARGRADKQHFRYAGMIA